MSIPINPIRKIIKNTTELRTGRNASQTLITELEEQATLIAETAGKIARHHDRKTITSEDILLAVEIL